MIKRLRILKFLFILLLISVSQLLITTPVSAGTNYFDDSGPVYLEIGNTDYIQLDFVKFNSVMTAITNNQNSQQMSSGTAFDLWVAKFYQSNPVAQYSSSLYGGMDPELAFSYTWDQNTGILNFDYDGSGKANSISVNVDVQIYDAPYVDFTFSVDNHSGGIINEVDFVNLLGILYSGLEEVLIPESPGIILDKGYFYDGPANYVAYHPSKFADFVAFKHSSANLAVYPLWTEENFTPSTMTLTSSGMETDVTFQHAFDTWITNGESWIAPTIRVRLFDNFFDVTKSFRTDTGMDEFSSLETKLGIRYEQIVKSPLFHVDPLLTTYTFDEWDVMLAERPSPAIIFLSNFWEGGFHGYHPDYIPPDSQYGTEQDLIDAVSTAHDNNQLVMPFTLPNWWHEDSPTVTNLPVEVTINDISMLSEEGNPDYGSWTLGEQTDWGYYVSPYNTYVQNRLDDAFTELTEDIGVDLIYEDVVGARRCYFDFNASNSDAMSCTGWYNHLEGYKDIGVVTETGYDLFTKNAIGFLGSSHVIWHDLDTDYGAGNWRGFPFVQSVAHDKVMSYQYWADYSATKEALGWNMAMGFMLNYTLIHEGACGENCPQPMGSDWEDVVGDFQEFVVSEYASKELTDFSDLDEDGVTVSTFEDITVTRNWSEVDSYTIEFFLEIPSLGFYVESDSRDLRAGVFTTYNGVDLEGDESYLIVKKDRDSVTVHMPLGEDTSMNIFAPESWSESEEYTLKAYDREGEEISDIEYTMNDSLFVFTYEQEVLGASTSYYEFAPFVEEVVDDPEPTGEEEEEDTGEGEEDTENEEVVNVPVSVSWEYRYLTLDDEEEVEDVIEEIEELIEEIVNPKSQGINEGEETEEKKSVTTVVIVIFSIVLGSSIVLFANGAKKIKWLIEVLRRMVGK